MIFDLDGLDAFIPVTGYTFLSSESDEVNFCDRAKDRLIHQFKTKPNLEKYLCVFADEFTELQSTLISLKNLRKLSAASNAQLDGLGDIVGVERLGRTDTQYRAAIYVQIILNRSNGEPETLLAAVKSLTDSTEAHLTEIFPAEVHILFNGLNIPSDLINSLERSAPAGVLIETTATYGEEAFTVEADPGETPLVGDTGFSEPNYAPDAGLGGAITEKIT